MNQSTKEMRLHIFLLATLVLIFAWSLIGCFDLLTWGLEAFPAIIGLSILISVYRKFRLTNLVYFLIWIHVIILLIGAHYTYARMPLFNWIRDAFELSRNHYDRLGHVAQGFVPAMIARELLLRKSPLERGKWLFFIVVCICLAISAFYELLEWTAAVISAEASQSFLGLQGDNWDTQKDMALCLAGAVAALLLLRKRHDRALGKLENSEI
jgi:putative membrane protein